MSLVWPAFVLRSGDLSSAKAIPVSIVLGFVERGVGDPIYYADVVIQNAVVGSAYWLGYDVNGVFTTLDSGVVATSDFTIPNVPSYTIPMLLELRIRKSSAAPKYLPYKTFTSHTTSGTTIYTAQIPDTVAL